MSADRRRLKNDAPTRPLMPRLATSTTSARSGPAPRLAVYNSPTNGTFARRPLSTNDSNTPPPRLAETKGTPVKTLTSPNVTPRSSSRKTRPESIQSTPTLPLEDATSHARPTSMLSHGPISRGHTPTSEDPSFPYPKRKREQVGEGQGSAFEYPFSFPIGRPSLRDEQALEKSEDVDSLLGDDHEDAHPKPARPALHKKTSSFVYANGDDGIANGREMASPSRLSIGDYDHMPSFSRANGTPKPAATTAEGACELPPKPIVPTPVSLPARNILLPGSSPPREGFHLSYRKGVSQIIRPSPLPPHQEATQRQTSLDSTSDRRHSRQFSSSPVNPSPSKPRRVSQIPQPTGASPLVTKFSLPTPKPSPTLSPNRTAQEASSPRNSFIHPYDATLIDRIQSPTSTTLSGDSNSNSNSATTRSNDRDAAAAGARQERKILDLQISNSSLLAINRSIEKELRRQKAELRRYKRVTRNMTRASLASEMSAAAGGHDGLSTGRLSMLPCSGRGNSLDANEDASDRSESESEDDDSARGSQAITHDRLKLDLSKHRELLEDSTKLNQGLKRCLGVSEMLIKDGKKALEYRVPSPEAAVGGRVLSPDDLETSLLEADGHDEPMTEEIDGADLLEAEQVEWKEQDAEAEAYFGQVSSEDFGVEVDYVDQAHDADGEDGMFDAGADADADADEREEISNTAEDDAAAFAPPPLPSAGASRLRPRTGTLLSPPLSSAGSRPALAHTPGVLHSVPSLD